jgi:pimeloyl-ACP methyl ester carboxylesterase
MKKAYADTREGQIHYRIEGKGKPILLLHMAEASSDEYTRVLPFLSKKYCAIAIDFLGNGESDKPPYPYQMIDHAQTVVNFMDCLGIKKATVVGHHIGAKIAAELAITSPKRMHKLVLSSLGYWGKTGNNPPDFTGSVEIQPDGSHLMEWWRRASTWGDPPEIVEERFIEYVKAGPRGVEMHQAGRGYDPGPRLPLINCPTLVLSATHDPFYSAAEEVKRLVPKSKLTIIENGPPWIDRIMPEEFANAILDFLKASGE